MTEEQLSKGNKIFSAIKDLEGQLEMIDDSGSICLVIRDQMGDDMTEIEMDQTTIASVRSSIQAKVTVLKEELGKL